MDKYHIPSFAIPPHITYESMFKGITEWFNNAKNVSLDQIWGNNEEFLNIPFARDWTLLLFIAIIYFKCNIVFHGMKYKFPFTFFGGLLLPLYELLSRVFPSKVPIPYVDDESLLNGLYDHKVQVCMTIFTAFAVLNPHCALILDVCFLGICFWQLLYLYRNNIREYVFLWCSLFVLYKEKHLFSSGVSWMQLYYLLAFIYILMKFTLPKKVNIDVVLFYYCAILYIIYGNLTSISEHGIVPPKSLKEYLVLSWMGQLMTNLTEIGSNNFEWMPLHVERVMIYKELY